MFNNQITKLILADWADIVGAVAVVVAGAAIVEVDNPGVVGREAGVRGGCPIIIICSGSWEECLVNGWADLAVIYDAQKFRDVRQVPVALS